MDFYRKKEYYIQGLRLFINGDYLAVYLLQTLEEIFVSNVLH